MYKCKVCKNEFNYKDILKVNMGNKDIVCRKCNQHYSVSMITKIVGIIPIILVPYINTRINGSWGTFILISLIYIIIIMLLSPFFTRLSKN